MAHKNVLMKVFLNTEKTVLVAMWISKVHMLYCVTIITRYVVSLKYCWKLDCGEAIRQPAYMRKGLGLIAHSLLGDLEHNKKKMQIFTLFNVICFSIKMWHKTVEVCMCGCTNNSTLLAIVSELCDFMALAAVKQLETRLIYRARKQESWNLWERFCLSSLCVSHGHSLSYAQRSLI